MVDITHAAYHAPSPAASSPLCRMAARRKPEDLIMGGSALRLEEESGGIAAWGMLC